MFKMELKMGLDCSANWTVIGRVKSCAKEAGEWAARGQSPPTALAGGPTWQPVALSRPIKLSRITSPYCNSSAPIRCLDGHVVCSNLLYPTISDITPFPAACLNKLITASLRRSSYVLTEEMTI